MIRASSSLNLIAIPLEVASRTWLSSLVWTTLISRSSLRLIAMMPPLLTLR